MNIEDQITQTVKENHEREVAAEQQAAQPQSTAPSEPQKPLDTGFVDDMGDSIDMYKLYDYFNVEPHFKNGQEEQKIQYIYRWAAEQAGSSDFLAVANIIMYCERGMSKGLSAQTRLDKVYTFVKLEKQVDAARQEQGLLYG